MKIGIDCRTMSDPVGEPAGIGHYTLSLVRALVGLYREDEFILFVDHHAKENDHIHALEKESNVTVVRFPFSEHKRYLPLVHSHWMVARMMKRHALDVFHATANTLPLGYSGTAVVTIHDLAVFEHPEWFPDSQLVPRTLIIPKTVQKAKQIIAVSEATKQQVMRVLHVPEEKISVIPEGVDHITPIQEDTAAFLQNRFGLEAPYIVCVGTIEPRKNVARLLKVFDRLLDEHPRHRSLQLVLAGKRGWNYADVDATFEAMHWKANVQELGYVTAYEKTALYQQAMVCVCPSLDEGFGLPALEAQFLGTPLIASHVGGLAEIVAPGVPTIDPLDDGALYAALQEMLDDPAARERVSVVGHAFARDYMWEKVARQTYAIYRSVLE